MPQWPPFRAPSMPTPPAAGYHDGIVPDDAAERAANFIAKIALRRLMADFSASVAAAAGRAPHQVLGIRRFSSAAFLFLSDSIK